jgi:hypothetical protein
MKLILHQYEPIHVLHTMSMNDHPIAGLPAIPLPEHLAEGVFAAIFEAKIRRLRARLVMVGAALIAVIAFAAAAVSSLIEEVRTSSTFDYFRLLVTDFGFVTSHVKEYAQGALEVVPVGSILTALLAALLLLGTVGFAQALYRSSRRQSRPMIHA